jgi:hypothetical protein
MRGSRPFNRFRFSRYARDLAQAVYELSREGDPVSFLPTSRTIQNPVLSTPGAEPAAPVLSPSQQLDGHLASAIAELSSTKVTSMTAPAPGSFAASLRAMMEEARAGIAQARSDGLAKVGEAVQKLNDAKLQTQQVTGSMAKTIADEADAVLAELGQISNLPPE